MREGFNDAEWRVICVYIIDLRAWHCLRVIFDDHSVEDFVSLQAYTGPVTGSGMYEEEGGAGWIDPTRIWRTARGRAEEVAQGQAAAEAAQAEELERGLGPWRVRQTVEAIDDRRVCSDRTLAPLQCPTPQRRRIAVQGTGS